MKSLTTILKRKQGTGETILVPYLMAGASSLQQLPAEITALAKGGAAAIEVGIPFSDPVADGPVIQEAGLRALAQQVSLAEILEVLKNFNSPVPLILMGYFNPFYAYGLEKFVAQLADTDVKGLIIPDLPYEHRNLVTIYLDESDVALVPLVTLTSTKERIATLVASGEGFIYAVTVNGVTGTGRNYRADLDAHLKYIHEISEIPVLAGFGVSEKEHVERFRQSCDGVVIGSKIVRMLAEEPLSEVTHFVEKLLA
ncbi:tryptophan synthase subunit alpha [Enterococcus sp. HY326]|uniref:tryptophan synthase subunit alpha n=1 Tax=Enterococcus sp. HY326 TaxID=2971265 RepID=UPI00223F579A|nr:tryptophan synthase subunit alpha [Enterococcus sp. HY326]